MHPVRSKSNRSTVTYWLDSPDLLELVRGYNSEALALLPPQGAWYGHLLPSRDTAPQVKEPGAPWHCRLNKDLHEWLDCVGLPYQSQHKFKRGQATYALKRCRHVADLKAVNQNLIHSSLQMTDSIYNILRGNDVGERIGKLGNKGEDKTLLRDLALVAVGLNNLLDQTE